MTTALTGVENNVSNLVKITGYNNKISETKNKITIGLDRDKYITIQELNKLASESFIARLEQANLARNNGIANFIKKTDFNNKLKRLTSNKK